MANRPVFEVLEQAPFFRRVNIEFTFYNGFSFQQKQRCIRSLHESYKEATGNDRILEVSSKSENPLGNALSAYNLATPEVDGLSMTVESLFQGSKVFEQGGPFHEMYRYSSQMAHRESWNRKCGQLVGFQYFDQSFPKDPPTFFFDWLYANVLHQNSELIEEVAKYSAFTDIEFNPIRQKNCQAEAVAIYVGLRRSGKLWDALKDKEAFKEVVFG